jgi:RHS repeat-associated protein
MQDAGGTTSYSYDSLNRPEAQVTPGPRTISYEFDAAGNRSLLVDPDGGRTSYSYDGRRLLSSLVNAYGERTTWQYDVAGRVTTMTHGNASIAETDYDAAGRIAAVRNLKSDRSVLSVFTYSYDASGNRTGVQEANGDRVTWSYDALNQLVREARSGANADDVTFTYDAAGNRLTKLAGGTTTTYSYDAANELSVEVTPSQRTTYSYDANGNTAAINAGGQLTTYTWDIDDHITGVQLPGGGRNTFTYDGDGKRRRTEESASARDLLWDAENILREQEGASVVAQYTHAPERYGALVSQRRGDATSFHHFDALGSTDRLTDSSQSALISYLYRAFGEQTVLSGSHANPLTWVGRLGYYRQPDSGDYWLRARVYRPTIGRFVSRDPVPQANLYIIPGDSAVMLVDPGGAQPVSLTHDRQGPGGPYHPGLPPGVRDMPNEPSDPWRGISSQGRGVYMPGGWAEDPKIKPPSQPTLPRQPGPPGLAMPFWRITKTCEKISDGSYVPSPEGPWNRRPVYPRVCSIADDLGLKRPAACCPYDYFDVYVDALGRKCRQCAECCDGATEGWMDITRQSPVFHESHDLCMFFCMTNAKDQSGNQRGPCTSSVNAAQEYKDAVKQCVARRS